MSNKTKIIIIIVAIIVEIGLLVGSYFIGRYTRYNGSTDIGENALNQISGANSDVNSALNGVNMSLDLLNSSNAINLLNYQTIEFLKSNNVKKDQVIDNFIDRFAAIESSLDSFTENYKGSSEDMAWDLVIKESEEMERLLNDYKKIVDEYLKEKGKDNL